MSQHHGRVRHGNRTLIQFEAKSSTSPSNRIHRALVHCGAVTFVGSVRTRERYIRLAAVVGVSRMPKLSARPLIRWGQRSAIPFVASFAIPVRSKANLIRDSTVSAISSTTSCTSCGRTRKLCAVCKAEARRDRFWNTGLVSQRLPLEATWLDYQVLKAVTEHILHLFSDLDSCCVDSWYMLCDGIY